MIGANLIYVSEMLLTAIIVFTSGVGIGCEFEPRGICWEVGSEATPISHWALRTNLKLSNCLGAGLLNLAGDA